MPGDPGEPADDAAAAAGGLRAEVAESWHRSAAAGVRFDQPEAPITLPDDDLRDYRAAHPLARVFPLLEDILGQAARDTGSLMAVSDAAGQLLWVCGNSSTLRSAESIAFVEGSNWDERLAGTNAPGLALRLDRPVGVLGGEHFRRSVQDWSCVAAPIHDPSTVSLLGVLDVTGGPGLAVPQAMAMVRAAARMAEAELARGDSGPAYEPLPGRGTQLLVEGLGRSDALLTISADGARSPQMRLSPRHSEILVLLAGSPTGLTGDELAIQLYAEDGGSSTLRAELNRLRSLLGAQVLASRPYRLAADVMADWLAVEAQAAGGQTRAALQAYRGPLLPRSTAPGVIALRDAVHGSLRRAVLTSGEADLMSTWTRSAWGADDYEMWQALQSTLSATSPMQPLVQGQLARLDSELG
ncbi:GAF domain-containing protein [Nocardioides sp. YIM 152588]|uniref:GAF domain-containing protein n=1 Tax=Nocardioides sp. YIM 152588 TaxID=3158259 RepID=UPI0032E4A92C